MNGWIAEPDVSLDSTGATGLIFDDRYQVGQVLGRGGSASVYRGIDLRLRRTVAVKIFHREATDSAKAARQRAEMFFLARLNHPNLVSIFDARLASSTVGGSVGCRVGGESSYLVMEFVEGRSLADQLCHTATTLDDAAVLGVDVARALSVVHGHGLIHRDVKPANILLPATGGAKLTDFGVARLLGSAHLTTTSEVVGTPLYLSPEQVEGSEVGPPCDIYSLGLTLLECISGSPEFPGSVLLSAMARLLRDPVVPPALPAPWPELLRSMTSPIPAERPTAEAVAAVLGNYLAGRDRSRTATTVVTRAVDLCPDDLQPAFRAGSRPPERRPSVRRTKLVVFAGAFAVGVLTVAVCWTGGANGGAGGGGRPAVSAPTPHDGRPGGTGATVETESSTTMFLAVGTDRAEVELPVIATVTTTSTAITTSTRTADPTSTVPAYGPQDQVSSSTTPTTASPSPTITGPTTTDSTTSGSLLPTSFVTQPNPTTVAAITNSPSPSYPTDTQQSELSSAA